MITLRYHLFLLKIIFIISSLTATCIMGVLSIKFLTWLKANRSWDTFAYLLASLCLSVNAILGIIYVSDQLRYEKELIHPSPYGSFITHTYSSPFGVPYTISSTATFVLFWIGTAILLKSYGNRLWTVVYMIIMSALLFYNLLQFDPFILQSLLTYSSGNPLMFSTTYVLLNISAPIGGIIFSFILMKTSRSVSSLEVRSYVIISGIGLLLLFMSYQSEYLTTASFPPFGILSASFMGLSSYLILVGIYSSALSISQDSTLRASIRRSVKAQVSFIGSLGDAQMTRSIIDKVLSTSKTISDSMPAETGIATSLTDKEIKDYIQEVLRETQRDKDS